MPKSLFTFPGQGAQYVGMLESIPNRSVWLRLAEMTLGRSLDGVDSAAALQDTQNVQICLLIAGCAYAEDIISKGIVPQMTCGLSIGAFAAAVLSRSLRFEDALRVVSLRGQLMQLAYPTGFGMTAISGLPSAEVERLCLGLKQLFVANYNAPMQTVVAGSDSAMQALSERALAAGAQSCKRLTISVPSHCALLDDASQKLQKAFTELQLNRPRIAYLSGSTGRVLWNPEAIKMDLLRNMARSTHWHDAMVAAGERGITAVLEMPPGSVLTKLTRGVLVEGYVAALSETPINDITFRLGLATDQP